MLSFHQQRTQQSELNEPHTNHKPEPHTLPPLTEMLNSRTNGGETPLHYAVTVGSSVVVNILLQSGADASIEAKRGSPLDLALGYPLANTMLFK